MKKLYCKDSGEKSLINSLRPYLQTIIKPLLVLLFLLISLGLWGQRNYQTRATGNWNANNTWQVSVDGGAFVNCAVGDYPGVAENTGTVTILNNHNVTLNLSPANSIGSLVIASGANATTLTFGAEWVLNVIGDVNISSTNANVAKSIALNTGILNCSNLNLTSSNGNDSRDAFVVLTSGTLTINGDITMNAAGARTYLRFNGGGTINVGGTISGGNITSNGGGHNTNAPTAGTVNYNGTSGSQYIGTYTYFNLSVEGNAVKQLSGNTSVNNELSLNGGVIQLGNFNLTMTNANPTGKITGSFGASSMVETDGSGFFIINNVNSNRPNILFPIGSEGYYTPFNMVTTGNTNNSNISVRTVKQFINGNFVGRYWDVVSNNTRTATLEFTYDASEANGSPANYTTWTKTGAGSWILSDGTTTLGTYSFTVAGGTNNITATAKSFTAGAIGTYYSYESGPWNEANTWTTDPSGTTRVNPAVPSDNDVVVILVDKEVWLTSNVTAANIDIQINDGGTLNQGTFSFTAGLKALHGQGKLKLASASFPTATTNTLVQAGGGTVEYTAPVTLPVAQTSYNHLEISAAGVVLQASNITVRGNLTINSGTYQINDGTTQRLQLSVDGDLLVKSGASITTGTGNTTSGGNLSGGTAPFTNYYDTYSHRIVLNGNFTNNGTVRFTNQTYPTYTTYPTNGFATVYFMGATDNLVYCNGQTDFHNLVLDKGTDQTFKLTVQSTAYSNFRLFGRNDMGGDGGTADNPNLRKALWIRTGSLVLQGLLVIPSLTEGGGGGTPNSDFYVPANAALILDGPEVVVLSTADDYREVNVAFGISGGSDALYGINKGAQASSFSIYGKLQINNGYFSTRESGGFITWDTASGQFIITGGTIDAKQYRAAGGASGLASYEQSGGTLILRGRFQRIPTQYTTINDLKNFTAATLDNTRRTNGLEDIKGTFNINNPANVFNMSGGTIRIYDVCGTNPYAVDIFAAANNISVTGGTLEIDSRTGNVPADDRDFTIRSNAPLGNLRVIRTSGAQSTLLDNAYSLTVVQNLEVVSGVLNTQNTNVTVGGNIRFYNGATYTAGTGTLTLNGADDQQFRIDLASALALQNLRIEKNKYFHVEFAGSQKTVNIAGDLWLENAELKDNGNNLNVAGNVYNAGTHTGTGRIHFNGSSLQTISGSGEFGNLRFQNTNGTTAPISLASNVIVNGLITFNNNKLLNIGNYNLRLTETASFASNNANRYITSNGAAGDGGVTKVFNSNSEFVFPVGSGGYTPVSLTVNGTPNSYGAITVVPVAYAHPNVTAPGRSLNYFWRVKSSDFDLGSATISHSYTYLQSSVVAGGDVSEAGYVPARFNSAVNNWTKGVSTDINTTSNVISGVFLTDVDFIDGDYTAGDDDPINPFGMPVIYYSRQSGFWDQTSTWSLTGHTMDNAPGTIPGASDIVIIGNGHKVDLRTHNTNINTGVQSCASLQIEAGATLDVGYNPGSNFNLVRSHPNGNGLIRITTSYTSGSTFAFPSGDFSDFNNNLGTTELYSTNPTAGTTYWLPNGISTYGNLIISPLGGSNIIFANNDVTILGNCTLKGQNADSWFLPTWNGNYPTAPAARVAKTITIKGNFDIQGGSFGWYGSNGGGAQNVVVEGNVIVAPGAGIDVWSPNTSQSMAIGGSLINNSTNTIASGTSTRSYVNFTQVPVTFFGANNAQITNTAGSPRTDFSTLTINKGNSKETSLICNIGGTLNTPTNDWLTIQNGTFEYSRTGNLSITTTSAFTIPASGGLHINTPSEVLIGNASNNNADLFLNGKLSIANGDLYIGPKTFPNNNNDIEYSAGGAAEIELTGGRLFVNGQIRRNPATSLGVLKYSQSGNSQVTILGNAAIPGNAKLEIANSGSSFSMADDSKLIIVRGGGTTFGDLYLRPETSDVTGGEILFSQVPIGITVDAVQTYTLDATVPLNNITITGKTAATARNATVKLLISPLILNGHLTLSNIRSFFDANVDYNINVTIGGDLDNNGTYNHYNNTTTFAGGIQTIKGNTATGFYDLVINPVTSLSVIRNVSVTRHTTIGSGTLILGANTLSVGGNLVNNSTYTTAAGALNLNGNSGVQQISGTGTFGRLEINNPSGARLNNDVTLQSNLRLTQGILNINQYLLTLGTASVIEGTPDVTRMITSDGVYTNQGVKKVFNASYTGTYVIPVGSAGKYTPARLQVTANTGGAGYLRVNPVNSQHPSALSPYRALKYYWDVESSGLTGITGNMQLTYFNSDVLQSPDDEALYVAARLLTPGTSWSKANPGPDSDNVNENTDVITFTYSASDDLSGEYTASVDTDIPDNIPVYRTVKDGDWDDPSVWEQVSIYNPYLPAIPNGFIVQIDHDIAVNVQNIFTYRATINGRLKFLASFSGHNIGNVDGSGTLYLESATFPAGKYTDFLNCANNAVLEYGGESKNYTINASLYSSASTVKITGSGTRTMPNKNLVFCQQLIFDGPVINMTSGSPVYTILGTLERYNSSTLNATNATIAFAGSAPQTIGGILGDFNESNALNRLQINNAQGLTINGPTDIKALTLTTGLIHTSSSNPLRIVATANNVVSASTGNANSYVNGPLTKRISSGDFFSFPIGKSGVWGNKLRLSNSLTGVIDWTAEFFAPNSTYTEKKGDMSAVDSHGFYRVSAPNGSTAVVNLIWDSQSDVTPLVTANGLTDMRVSRFNTSEMKWEEVASTASGNNVAGMVSTLTNETMGATASADYAIGSVNSIKPKAQFNTGTYVCGLTSGLPITIVATGAVAFNYTITYSINNVPQAPVTITSMPYTLATSVSGNYKLISFTFNNGTRTGVVDGKTVSVYELPTAASAGGDKSLCGASSTTLEANTPIIGTGLWSVVSGIGGSFIAPTAPNSEFNGTNGTNYTLRWTISNGQCSSSDDVSIAFPLLPIQPGLFTESKTIVCQGEEGVRYTVPVIPAAVYNWSYSGNGVTINGVDNSVTLDFSLSATSGILSVYTTNGCGNSTARNISITVNNTPSVSLAFDGGDPIVCFGETVSFSATNTGPSINTYEYFVNNVSSELSSSPSFIYHSPSDDYTVFVIGTTSNGCSDVSNVINISINQTPGIWIGTEDEDWMKPTNWCSGLAPMANADIEISSKAVNNPTINSALTINNLTIQSGTSLTLAGAAKVTVNGSLINNGTLVINNNSEIDGLASLITKGTITGTGSSNIKLTLPKDRWFYITSGISSATLGNFSTGNAAATVHVHRNNQWYSTGIANVNTALLPLEGVLVKYASDPTFTIDYAGAINNGPLTRNYTTNGWYLFGNPYPSFINWQDDAGWNRPNIDGTMWYRTLVGSDMVFITYNRWAAAGARVAMFPSGTWGSESDLANIPPMQAVWVKAFTPTSISVNNDARNHGVSGSQLKSSSANNADIIRIVASNNSSRDGAVVYFSNQSLETLDKGDSEKRFNDSQLIPEVYTRIGTTAAAINGLTPLDNNSRTIPLSVRNRNNQNVTLHFDLDKFNPIYSIYLEDKLNGQWSNLRVTNAYTYTPAVMGEVNDRFIIHISYVPTSVVNPEENSTTTNSITITGIRGKAVVKIDSQLLNTEDGLIEVYTMEGQKVSETITAASETLISLPRVDAMFVVKVTAGGTTKTEKVLGKY